MTGFVYLDYCGTFHSHTLKYMTVQENGYRFTETLTIAQHDQLHYGALSLRQRPASTSHPVPARATFPVPSPWGGDSPLPHACCSGVGTGCKEWVYPSLMSAILPLERQCRIAISLS